MKSLYLDHNATTPLRPEARAVLLEELDAFSADCSMRHADGYNPQRPLTVVTAAHDGLSIFAEGHRSPLSSRHDLRLRGCVVGVGTSSMEVQTDLLRVHSDGREEEYLGSCFTVMVARECEGFGKAAVHQLTRHMGADLAPQGVNVNAIAPGFFPSKMTAHLLPFEEEMVKTVPCRRLGGPEDAAGTAIYLCSRAGAWVTGHTLALDGGFVANAG